jgi:pSer/pThr/pTyr-binding forkhead associated (FHA) protein
MSNETKSPVSAEAAPRVTLVAAPIPSFPEETIAASLHITLREGGTMERELTKAETRLGKGPDNDIVLGDQAVSSNHALIRLDGEKYMLIDVGSRNGTFLNNERLSEARALKNGDIIKLGHCRVTFRAAQAGQTLTLSATEILGVSAVPPPPPAPPTPSAPPLPSEDTLARALVHSKIVAIADIERVQKSLQGRRLYRALLDEKLATELGLRDLLARTFNLQPVDLRAAELDTAMAQKLKPQFLREKLLAPLVSASGELLLAVADPTDQAALEQVKKQAGKALSLRLGTASEISAQLDKHFVPRLVGVLPTGEKIEVAITQPETAIGKAAHNRLVLNDITVSSTHAAILARDGGYSIVDLESSNGTFVNGARLTNEARTLQHGDKIQLGKVLLTFRNPAETVENKTARLSLEALEEIRRRSGLTTGANAVAAAAAAPPPVATAPVEDDEKGEKKKKKKEKEKEKNSWFNVNALSRIFAQLLAALISLGGLIWVATRQTPGNGGGPQQSQQVSNSTIKLTPGAWQKFDTSLFGKKPEASGVIAVPGASGVLFVDDGRKNEIVWMPLNENGMQAYPLKPVPLNAPVEDAEAITYGSQYFYVVTSQSDPANANAQSLLRFSFDPQTQTIRGAQAEAVTDLRSFLLQNVPEIAARGAAPGLQGGLNIEGMAYDPNPNNERLLLGLRSPFVGTQAVLVPLKLINPLMPLAVSNLKVDQPSVITLSLDGQGVRDINYDSFKRHFLILSGSPETQKKTDFGLWEWSGDANEQPRKIAMLDEKYKPEGITAVTINGQNFVIVVGDAGSYLKLDYK